MVKTRKCARLEGLSLCFGRSCSSTKRKRWPVNASSRPDLVRLQPKFVHPGAEKEWGWPLCFSMGNPKSWMYGVLAARKDHTEKDKRQILR